MNLVILFCSLFPVVHGIHGNELHSNGNLHDNSSDNYAHFLDEEERDNQLFFEELHPFVPCGDGSSAGIYREASSSISDKHIIIFLGGGVCDSEDDCLKVLHEEPYKLSSIYFPKSVQGDTILSTNTTENPIASSFTRWLVPYCSQDLYLGGKGKETNNVTQVGSSIFKGALNQWERSVEGTNVDTLIVAGISAGAIGLMNHFGSVVDMARNAEVGSLRTIMDSSAVSDELEGNFQTYMEKIVDFNDHPLCNQNFTHNIQPKDFSSLPCCVSVHCMLEHDPVLSNWTREEDSVINERLLLVDSIYDPLALLSNVTKIPSNPTLSMMDRFSSQLGETAGARRERFLQSTYSTLPALGNRVLWAASSAMTHQFLVPCLTIEQLRCEYGKLDGSRVCRNDGVGARTEFVMGLYATGWVTTKTWELASVAGKPIRDWIKDFVYEDPQKASYGLARDNCHGANCVDELATETNPAQQLFELEDTFVPVHPVFQFEILCSFLLLISAYILCLYLTKLEGYEKSSKEETEICTDHSSSFDEENPSPKRLSSRPKFFDTIKIQDVSVQVAGSDTCLLKNVSFEISPGSLNGLVGLSGSGKTTLLNLLSGQLPTGLASTNDGSEFNMKGIRTTYLRQLDFGTMQNMSPKMYLTLTARLYGAPKKQLTETLEFVRPFFMTRNLEGCHDDPFSDTKIKDLSGGQKRIVTIVASLFINPTLLLLDEPLSGLDSVSCNHVMALLQNIVKDGSCSVMITIHQPSDETIENFDQLLLMNQGEILLATSVASLQMNDEKKTPALFIHEILQKCGSHRDRRKSQPNRFSLLSRFSLGFDNQESAKGFRISTSSKPTRHNIGSSFFSSTTKSVTGPSFRVNGGMQLQSTIVEESSRVSVTDESSNIPVNETPSKLSGPFWQIPTLVRRMYMEYGSNLNTLIRLPVCFIIMTLWFQFDSGSPLQVLYVTVLFCTAPVSLFRDKVHDQCKILCSHQLELEDGRVSYVAFLIGSFFTMCAMPLLALLIALIVGYLILGWEFNTFIDQFLFSGVYLLVSFQIGKALSAYYSGDYSKVIRVYTLYVFMSFLFSGALVPPNKVPDYLSWVIYGSFTFWGVAGSSLTHFHYNGQIGENPCLSFSSCVAYDSAFLGRFFGYTPIATASLSMTVMTVSFGAFLLLEYFILRWR